jgi:hypothetical protein
MTLAAFFFFLAGALGEILLLWSAAQRSGSRLAGRFVPPAVAIERLIVLGLAGLALLASIVLGWLGIAEVRVSLDDGWVGALFVVLGLFLLGAGVIGDALLPRVNERVVLSTQIVVAILALTSAHPSGWPMQLILVGLPLFGSLALVFYRRNLAPPFQALVYFGYLLALLALTFQTANLGYFSALELDSWQALAFGSLFIFLLLHALFAVRFFLIVSSLLLPRNRPLISGMMPHLYSNEQVSLARFAVFTGLLVSIILLNTRFHWLPPEILVSLAVMISAQGMGQARIGLFREGKQNGS